MDVLSNRLWRLGLLVYLLKALNISNTYQRMHPLAAILPTLVPASSTRQSEETLLPPNPAVYPKQEDQKLDGEMHLRRVLNYLEGHEQLNTHNENCRKREVQRGQRQSPSALKTFAPWLQSDTPTDEPSFPARRAGGKIR